MKNKIINLTISIFILFFTILSFFYANKISSFFYETFLFLIKVIIPSLFPFMIFINFILYSNTINFISIIFKPIGKIFNITGYGITCIIASLLGGYPYCAIIVSSFLKEKKNFLQRS